MINDLVKADNEVVNNDLYKELGERWYKATDDPVALLRHQNDLTTPWILAEIRKYIGYHAEILDVGCGAGFFSNEAAKAGHTITGIDIAPEALKVAELHDATKSVRYEVGDAYNLAYPRESFDVVVALDLLEHVTDPEKIIFEISRVLRPGGLFFFHTFNRNPWCYLFTLKGMEWFVKNTPHDLHVYSLFRKPSEVIEWIDNAGMDVQTIRGTTPVIFQRAFWKLLWSGEVAEGFRFRFQKKPLTTYVGYAKKLREQ
ncbi:3-demethylubiquinone-9 3-O-methyltransferase [Bdellovibrio sp. NC01]|nr:3-demethylubiquinone-9 3-O-methyltransferase [Bdellovibrio sp. NC01]